MTGVSEHSYSARVMPSGRTVKLLGGSLRLDASGIPHVTGDVTLAEFDTVEFDPREGARLELTAKRADAWTKEYSPWVEQRRNHIPNPRYAVDTAGWIGNASPVWQRVAFDGAFGGLVSQVPGVAVLAYGPAAVGAVGEFWALRVKIAAGPGLPPGALVRIALHDGTNYRAGNMVIPVPTVPTVIDLPSTSALTNTAPRAYIYSGSDWAGKGVIVSDWVMGKVSSIGASVGGFFDGDSNPSGELERTRWLGAVNNSASVVESREVTGQVPVFGTPRVFDLGIRSVSPDRRSGEMTVSLASDEALLQDFAQLDGDEFMRGSTSSLRTVVNHVLGYFGTALEPGTVDADVTARWKVTNRVLNPVADDVWGYVAGTNAKNVATGSNVPLAGPRYVTWSAVGAGDANMLIWVDNRVTPGDVLSAEAYVRTGTPGLEMRLTLRYRDGEGNTIREDTTAVNAASGTGWTPVKVLGSGVPEGAVIVSMFVTGVATAADQTFAVDFPCMFDGIDPVPRFHGGFEIDQFYEYRWAGEPNRSVSIRIPFVERSPEMLAWETGTTAMGFLEPLLKSAGIRLVCDERRRWTLRAETFVAAGSQRWADGEGGNVTTAREELSREDGAWFDAAVIEYTWTALDKPQKRHDAYALTASPKRVAVSQVNAPFPGRGRAEAMVKRAQGRGRMYTVTGIPTWTENTDQPTEVKLAVWYANGFARSVTYNLDDDTVTVNVITDDTPNQLREVSA